MKKNAQLVVYVASDYGFTEGGRYYYNDIFLPKLKRLGFAVIDPWRKAQQELFDRASAIDDTEEKRKAFVQASRVVGRSRRIDIERCDLLVACLDGIVPDTGVAGELSYAAGREKSIEAHRSDLRQSGENIAVPINLQLYDFVRKGGGVISATFSGLEHRLILRARRLTSRQP